MVMMKVLFSRIIGIVVQIGIYMIDFKGSSQSNHPHLGVYGYSSQGDYGLSQTRRQVCVYALMYQTCRVPSWLYACVQHVQIYV